MENKNLLVNTGLFFRCQAQSTIILLLQNQQAGIRKGFLRHLQELHPAVILARQGAGDDVMMEDGVFLYAYIFFYHIWLETTPSQTQTD